jgi:4-diphosphocytidyl-2-C-methyl-D-erythritol kinase
VCDIVFLVDFYCDCKQIEFKKEWRNMVERSYTRITLALDIIRKIDEGRFCGYHELGIVKHQIDLADIITIDEAPRMELWCDNLLVPCDSTNICWKAAELLKNHYNIDKNVAISIEKHIPVMGGLAGGSANAATALSLLDKLWDLRLSTEQLMMFGRKLGMDVPFFFMGKTAFDSEATECLEPISCNLEFFFILAIPEFGVSTKEAYGGIDYGVIGKGASDTKLMVQKMGKSVPDAIYPLMHNDFELSVFSKYPRLQNLKNQLIHEGCSNAVMSGSGSTIIGVTDTYQSALAIQKKVDCKTIVAQTLKK